MRKGGNTTVSYYDNSLGAIRLIAAFQVMYIHMISHLHIDMPEWISETISFFYGVPIFFGLSGYLVWRSLEKSNSFREYSLKRALRIFPELWVAVIIELAAILLTYDKSEGGYSPISIWRLPINSTSILDA